jgi:type IV pilus assembly protein PilO
MNRLRSLLTLLNLHLAGLAVVLILDIVVGVKLALAWSAIRSDQSDAFAQEQIHYGQLQAQMMHLQGLPKKVDQSGKDAEKFYLSRIAPNYSTVAAELGVLATKDQVRWSRAEYTQTPAITGLTQVRIDASLSGQYTQLMHFINDLERDKQHVFFTVSGLSFTGQQGGLVNLRLRVDTWLRSDATDLPPAPDKADSKEPGKGSGKVKAEPVAQQEVR